MNYTRLGQIGVVILATMGTCNKLPDKDVPTPEIIDTAINDTSTDTTEKVKKIIETISEKEPKLTLTQQEERFTEDIYKVQTILREADIYFMGYGMRTEEGMPITILIASHIAIGYRLSLPAEENINPNFRFNVEITILMADENSNPDKIILNKIIRSNNLDEVADKIEEIMEPTYFLEDEGQ